MMGIDTSFPSRVYERTTRYQDVILPEESMVAAWLMVMKMVHGLDGLARFVVLRLAAYAKR